MAADLHPVRIGSVQIPNNLALAPMAGTTDRVYRALCRRFGASLTVTELVSARGLIFDRKMNRNWRYLAIDPDYPFESIQLFGSDPVDFTRAIERIAAHPILSSSRLIDLNMGCPVKKVVMTGAGCALMRQPDRAEQIIRAAVEAAHSVGKSVTVKFRSGWDEMSINAPDFARMCEAAGASAITIHARTRNQMYGGRADWSVISDVRRAVKIPVYGNGDVVDQASALRMLRETGVDGLMIGRAAQGRPWLFSEIIQSLGGVPMMVAPDIDARMQIIKEHWHGLCDLLGEQKAMLEMRRHLSHYFQGASCASRLRQLAVAVQTEQDLLNVLEEWRVCQDKYCGNS